MNYRIETLQEKKLIGKIRTMSFVKNTTVELWQSFMPRRKEIKNVVGTELYSMQIYQLDYFKNFNPSVEFKKMAAVEVADFESIPDDMQSFLIPAGLYAVFHYKGDNRNAATAFQHILGTWLPNSIYELDTRPHFEVLGEKYKNYDSNSEEDIWIPIKEKNRQ